MRHLLLSSLILLGFLATAWAVGEPQNHDCWVYVGNYAKGEKRGIYLFRMDATTGALTAKGIAAEAEDANFLAVHPSGKWLYAVTSKKVGDYAGAVEAFAIDAATGKLTLMNRQPSGGAEPVHLAVDPGGACVVVANYSGASVASFPLDASGKLQPAASVIKHTGSSVDASRQKQPYPHGVAFDREGKQLLVADLGTDKVVVYDVDVAKGTLKERGAASVKPGSGPRHLAFSVDGKLVYVANEMANTVTLFDYDNGTLKERRTISPWEDATAAKDYLAEVATIGLYAYVSERGKDSIAVMAGEKVLQKADVGGKWPRHFAIDPTGRFLIVANQKSNSLTVLARDPAKGTLTPTAIKADVAAPVCVVCVLVQ